MGVEDRYIIQPSHPWWRRENWVNGRPLPEGFLYASDTYASDTNERWLTNRELQEQISPIAANRGLIVIEDACHALGAQYHGRNVGSISDMTVFSFHPAKHITTGEGGMVATNDPAFAQTLRHFRNHGISSEAANARVQDSDATRWCCLDSTVASQILRARWVFNN